MIDPTPVLIQSGAANALFRLLPVIILLAIVMIVLGQAEGSMSSGTSPAARRGFLEGIVGLGVLGLVIAYVVPTVVDIISETDVTGGIGLLEIASGEDYTLSGEETYTGVDIEETGTLTLSDGSQLNIQD